MWIEGDCDNFPLLPGGEKRDKLQTCPALRWTNQKPGCRDSRVFREEARNRCAYSQTRIFLMITLP